MNFRIIKPQARFGIDVCIYRRDEEGNIFVVLPVEMKEHHYENGYPIPAAFQIETEEAQQLFDELYSAGFRPTRQDIR